uniref:Reverse transcriptase zinc-binding domain-containing protein n=1 Tax=Quercus lobata TaxID=97700 RepID=A0A7N2MX24_QUELO
MEKPSGPGALSPLKPLITRNTSSHQKAYLTASIFPNGVLFCELNFRRYSEDWELESFYSLMSRIYGASLRGVGDDKMCWKLAMGRGFAVRSYYQVLTKSFDQSFPWKTIWKSKVPSSVTFFVWFVALGNILTIDSLRKRKILILDWCLYRGSTWRRLAPYDALRPWQNRAMVGIVSFKMGDSRWYRPLSAGAWHCWLSGWLLVCGLGGFYARSKIIPRLAFRNLEKELHQIWVSSQVFSGTLDEHMHLLLPALIRLFKVDASVDIRAAAIKTLTRLIPRVQVTGHISSLVHHLKLILDGKNDELRKNAVDALCCLAHALGEDFTIFIPSIHKLLLKHRLRHKEFEEIEGRLQRREPLILGSMAVSQRLSRRLPVEIISDPLENKEIDPYEDGSDVQKHLRGHQFQPLICFGKPELFGPRSSPVSSWSNSGPSVHIRIFLVQPVFYWYRLYVGQLRGILVSTGRFLVNAGRLLAAGEASQRSTKEDWAEWMRHFSIELLKESPSPALRTCARLAQLQPFIGRELFAAGFVSSWAQLNETTQKQLVRSLEMAFSSPNIPPEILGTLLNLYTIPSEQHCLGCDRAAGKLVSNGWEG